MINSGQPPTVPQRRPAPPSRTSSSGNLSSNNNNLNQNLTNNAQVNTSQTTTNSPLGNIAPIPVSPINSSNPPPSPLNSNGEIIRGRVAPPPRRGLVRGAGEGRGGIDMRNSGEFRKSTGELQIPERPPANEQPQRPPPPENPRGRGDIKRTVVPVVRRPPPPLDPSSLSSPTRDIPNESIPPPIEPPSPVTNNTPFISPPSPVERIIPKPPVRKIPSLSSPPTSPSPAPPTQNSSLPPLNPSLPPLNPTLPSLNPTPPHSPKKGNIEPPPRNNWQPHRKVPSNENPPVQTPPPSQKPSPPHPTHPNSIPLKPPPPLQSHRDPSPQHPSKSRRDVPPPPRRTFVPEQSVVFSNIDPNDEGSVIKVELLTSEQSYVNACLFGLNVYSNIDPSQISDYERESIFSNMQEIIGIHKTALHSESSSVGDILLSLIPSFRLYWKYIANLTHAFDIVDKLKERGVFDSILLHEVNVTSIENFLETPHRHLGEYPSLIRDYIQRLQLKDDIEVKKLNKVLIEFDIIYDAVNRKENYPNHLSRLWDLEFGFDQEMHLGFTDSTFIVFEGEARLVRDSSESVRDGYDTLNLFIFNNGNCFITAPSNGYTLRMLIQSPTNKLSVCDVSNGESQFGLEITSNMRKLLASFPSLHAKRTWMNHLPVQYPQPRKLFKSFRF